MNKLDLLKQLKLYNPTDQHEEDDRNKTISFLETNPNAFIRENLNGHITASAWIVNNERSHILLCHHVKYDIWIWVGGHCDGNEDVLQVATKEAKEESNFESLKLISPKIYDVFCHFVPQYKDVPEHIHYDIKFLFEADKNEQLNIQTEERSKLKEVKWFNLDEARKVLKWYRAVDRLIKKTKTFKG